MRAIKVFIGQARRKLRRVPRGYIYLLIWASVNCAVSAVWPAVKTWAQTERGNCSVGGEMFLWLLGFVAVIAVDTVRVGRLDRETQKNRKS